MKSFIVDWRRTECTLTEIDLNYFKFKPLMIYTKDGFNLEMDARMIIQTDDDSIVVNNFGSFPDFVENTLNSLIRIFSLSKERAEIVSNRLAFSEELLAVLQKELEKFNVKIQKFIIVYMLFPRYVRNAEPKRMKEEIYHDNIPYLKDDKIKLNEIQSRALILAILLVVAILLHDYSLYINNKILMILVIIMSILIIVMGINQYFEIRELQIRKKEKINVETMNLSEADNAAREFIIKHPEYWDDLKEKEKEKL